MPLREGETILNGKYRILKLIGEGGMARVWLAEELTFGSRDVAIKEPHANLPSDDLAELRRRFQREDMTSNRQDEPNTATLLPSFPTLRLRIGTARVPDTRAIKGGEAIPFDKSSKFAVIWTTHTT